MDIYKTLNFAEFLVAGYNESLVKRKMKWTGRRQIKFTELILTEFEESNLTKEFFKFNGPSLKTLHISSNEYLTPTVSTWIQRYCTHLEALCIEKCALHVVIGDLISACPVKRLRLLGSLEWGTVPIKLLKRTQCPTLTELSLLDHFTLTHVPTIAAAFPNVLDLEMNGFGRKDNARAILAALFSAWPNLHTLRIHNAHYPDHTIWPLIIQQCPHLKKICLLDSVNCDPMALLQFLLDCPSLTSITLHDRFYSVSFIEPVHYARIVERLGARLEEFCIGVSHYDATVLDALAVHNPNLRVLELMESNRRRGVRCMVDVYKQCPLLEQLHININDAKSEGLIQELVDIATYCRNVHTLHFGQSHHVRRRDVVNLMNNCKKLKLVQTNNRCLLQDMGRVHKGVKIEFIPNDLWW